MKSILVACFVFLATFDVWAEQVIDVTKIAGRGETEVAAYLGGAESCSLIKYGKKCQYKKAETEVVFINGTADWITVEGLDHIPFNANALFALGLKAHTPSFRDPSTLRWSSIQGLLEVSIFKGESLSDYAYIKVATK